VSVNSPDYHRPEESQTPPLDALGAGKLEGSPNSPAFLFVHGFGTSPLDLVPLANVFHQQGHTCQLICLKGHTGNRKELAATSVGHWRQQIRHAYNDLRRVYRQVYLVGFYTGGTLAIDLAATESVAGVLSISTFLRPARPSWAAIVLFSAYLIGVWRPFRLRTTTPSTRKQLRWIKLLPYHISKAVVDDAAAIKGRFHKVKSPVLFLHSVSDKVASYDSVAQIVRTNPAIKSLIVTFFGLDHFLQLDLSPIAVYDLSMRFFGLVDDREIPNKDNPTMLAERLRQRSEDSRHWADMLFRLIIGFYTIISGFLYFSLPDVLEQKPKAPYYLIAYALFMSLFVKFAVLYFFYLNRVDSYIKYHLDPSFPGLSWMEFRTNPWASGRASSILTRRIANSTIGFPFLAAYFLILYVLVAYNDRFVILSRRNLVLQVGMVLGVCTWIIAGNAASVVMMYGKQRLYIPVQPNFAEPGIEERIEQLYSSVLPGSVSQPESLIAQERSESRKMVRD
jgi:esterase/lipase